MMSNMQIMHIMYIGNKHFDWLTVAEYPNN